MKKTIVASALALSFGLAQAGSAAQASPFAGNTTLKTEAAKSSNVEKANWGWRRWHHHRVIVIRPRSW